MSLELTVRNSKYGWIPDIPDQRDFSYITLAFVLPKLPPKVDLRKMCSLIENQGKLGSCTAQALVGNLEFIKFIKFKKFINFSRLFLYYNERVIRNSVNTDSGASLRDGIKTLIKLGVCLEKLWPYDINKFTTRPPQKAYKNAADYQIISYYRIHTVEEMKHTLSLGFPFVFGFAVYESFESKETAKNGIVALPDIEEHLLGGHAVMAVGYDDSKQWFIVRNSWGKNWGDKGYMYMPYGYFTSPNLSADFWTIRDME